MNKNIRVLQPLQEQMHQKQVKELRLEILDLINSDVSLVLLNLQNVTFLDSAGVGELVVTLRQVRSAKGELCLCSLQRQVKMLFTLAQLDRVFKVYADQEEFERLYPKIPKESSDSKR